MTSAERLQELLNTPVDPTAVREALTQLLAVQEQLRAAFQALNLQIVDEPDPQVDAYLQSLASTVRASNEFCTSAIEVTMRLLTNVKRMSGDVQGVLTSIQSLDASI